jgi:hypothetical protein
MQLCAVQPRNNNKIKTIPKSFSLACLGMQTFVSVRLTSDLFIFNFFASRIPKKIKRLEEIIFLLFFLKLTLITFSYQKTNSNYAFLIKYTVGTSEPTIFYDVVQTGKN